ncbi:MAG: hypothetical protein LBM87_01455 [Ruminococcus sp.]|jgi:hypothetical protein|nr:hypothetical protein [Ruminococcus sp.]
MNNETSDEKAEAYDNLMKLIKKVEPPITDDREEWYKHLDEKYNSIER